MKIKTKPQPDQAVMDLFRKTASNDKNERDMAQAMFAQALALPLRQGVLYGDVNNIFTETSWPNNEVVRLPLDILAPGQEDEFVAYTCPGVGYIAQNSVAGDFVTVPTYAIANAIDWELRFARSANWDMIARAVEVLRAGFVKKLNNDAWHTVITAGADRNVLVYDADATAGQFTKRLVSMAKVMMARTAGGNTASVKRGKLTDIFLSPEGLEDIRNWGVDQVDEMTRREIYVSSDDGEAVTRIFGVNLHDMVELGEGQEYQLFLTGQLGGSLASGDVELAIGVDMMSNDSFIMPVTLPIEIFYDDNMHRMQKEGYYGWGEFGFAVLDGRRTILMSY